MMCTRVCDRQEVFLPLQSLPCSNARGLEGVGAKNYFPKRKREIQKKYNSWNWRKKERKGSEKKFLRSNCFTVQVFISKAIGQWLLFKSRLSFSQVRFLYRNGSSLIKSARNCTGIWVGYCIGRSILVKPSLPLLLFSRRLLIIASAIAQ